MSNFRTNKTLLRSWLNSENWSQKAPLPPELRQTPPQELTNALFACLPEQHISARAGFTLGQEISKLYTLKGEDAALILVRRFLWHMNEESGNIGWGIPVAFAQTLAQCPPLAERYRKILLSYILDLPGDSNFCDHAPLRESCYDAVEVFLDACPAYREESKNIIERAQSDPDEYCKAKAQALLAKFYK